MFSIISPTAVDYYSAVSYGKLKLNLMPLHKWLHMSKPSGDYGLAMNMSGADIKAYTSEAVAIADPEYDFSQIDEIIVMTNPDALKVERGPAFYWGIKTNDNGKVLYNGAMSAHDLLSWKGYWLNHEMLHTMGLPDLYSFNPQPGQSQFFYTGQWSIMANILGAGQELTGWERWLLEWLEDDQVTCVGEDGGSFELTPIERASDSAKLLVTRVGDNQAVVAELRRPIGYDQNIKKPGILVYYVDGDVTSGEGPLRILRINDDDASKEEVTLDVGESLSHAGVTVTHDSYDEDSETSTVTITFD